MKFLNNKTILITGGTGSFGKKFTEFVLKNYNPKRIIIFSRDELKQFHFQNLEIFSSTKFKKKLRFFIGDIRDKDRLRYAINEDVDIVIHAAALKQVPTGEYNPFEVVKTNIIGSQNVIDSCLESNVQKIIALSTDKAAAPLNLYGSTKLTSDKLFINANNYKGKKKMQFSVVRYGNVMGSRGSVIPFFLKNKSTKLLTITDKRMTRFNITLTEGVKFVVQSIEMMLGGELFVPKIPSYNILELAKAISPSSKHKFIGIRPGEKLHEEMITSSDSFNTIEFEKFYSILPISTYEKYDLSKFIKKNKIKKWKKCKENFSYSSNNNSDFLSKIDIEKLIKQNLNDFET